MRHSRKYAFFTKRFLYKIQIRSAIEYSYHIWTTTAKFLLSNLDRAQNPLDSLLGDKVFSNHQSLPHRQIIVSFSFLYPYFHGKYSVELHSFYHQFRPSQLSPSIACLLLFYLVELLQTFMSLSPQPLWSSMKVRRSEGHHMYNECSTAKLTPPINS